jgi:hypothetical protein
MVKDIRGFRLITVGETFFQLINRSIVLQIWGTFQKHLSPHQLGVLTFRNYETYFLTSKPSLIYTLIGSWCKSTLKKLLITFFELLFLENYEMRKVFWWTLSPLPGCFIVFIFLFTTNMGNMKRGSPLLNHLQAQGRVTLKRSFICLGPLLNIPKDHYANLQLCLSIPRKWYPHHGPFGWNYPCLLTTFQPN